MDEIAKRIKKLDNKINPPTKSKLVNPIALSMELSIEFVVPIIIGGFLGSYLDKKIDIWPYGTIVFFILGFFSGCYAIFKSIKRL